MSPSLRFLAVATIGWAALRAATLGAIPGAQLFALPATEAAAATPEIGPPVPPLVATEFAPIDPPAPQPMAATAIPVDTLPGGAAYSPQPMLASYSPAAAPVYYYQAGPPIQQSPRFAYASLPQPARRAALSTLVPEPAPQFYAPIPQLADWPLGRFASAAMPARSVTIIPSQSTSPIIARSAFDRVQLSAWALLRGRQGLVGGPSGLATGGTLGGSQAGARLTYYVVPGIAASLRTSAPVGARGGEVAAGIKLVPFRSIPVAFTVERRQAIGRFGGRSAFAIFAEGGIYGRPLPWSFTLDGYLQGGVVGVRRRDRFIDGGFAVTRPLFRNFSGGFGVWGGAQPGLYRVDAGPRVTMALRRGMRLHLDWRQRLAGNAQPGPGPAVTLAADF